MLNVVKLSVGTLLALLVNKQIFAIFSPIRTLNLRVTSQMFYHCATRSQPLGSLVTTCLETAAFRVFRKTQRQ
jgi:hypothetical protein